MKPTFAAAETLEKMYQEEKFDEDFKLLSTQYLTKESRVVAQKDGKWGILKTDGSGDWIIAPEYDFISFPNNNFAVQKGDKWGIMDLSTKEFIVPLEQDLVYVPGGGLFDNGIAFYEKEGKTGFMNEYGQRTEAIFDKIDFDDSDVKVLFNGKWGYADGNGEFTLDQNESCFYSIF